jgi:chromosome segregation ATPase
MVKKREIKKGELVAADVVESGSYSSKEDEIYSEELKIQRALKYYHGRMKSQVGVVKDDVSLVLDVCREMKDELGKLSECSVNKISDLAFECLKVTSDRDALKAAYEDLESEHEDLRVEYEGLNEKFGELVEENDVLSERVSSLESELKEKTLWRCLKEKFHFA